MSRRGQGLPALPSGIVNEERHLSAPLSTHMVGGVTQGLGRRSGGGGRTVSPPPGPARSAPGPEAPAVVPKLAALTSSWDLFGLTFQAPPCPTPGLNAGLSSRGL